MTMIIRNYKMEILRQSSIFLLKKTYLQKDPSANIIFKKIGFIFADIDLCHTELNREGNYLSIDILYIFLGLTAKKLCYFGSFLATLQCLQVQNSGSFAITTTSL